MWTSQAFERDVAACVGERDQSAAQIARVQAAISEAEWRQRRSSPCANQWRAELSETMSKLGSLGEIAAAWRIVSSMRRSVRRSAVRSSAFWSTRSAWSSGKGSGRDRSARRRTDPRGEGQPARYRLPASRASRRPSSSAHTTSPSTAARRGGRADLGRQPGRRGHEIYRAGAHAGAACSARGSLTIPGMPRGTSTSSPGKKSVPSHLVKPVLRAWGQRRSRSAEHGSRSVPESRWSKLENWRDGVSAWFALPTQGRPTRDGAVRSEPVGSMSRCRAGARRSVLAAMARSS